MKMDVRAIRTEADLDWALAEVGQYFDKEPKPGTPEAERFTVLTDLIEAYEDKHWAMPDADPIEVIKHAIEDLGKSRADLVRMLGRGRTSEILARKRPLTLEMIRKISQEWKLPASLLTPPYELEADKAKPATRAVASPRARPKAKPAKKVA